MTLAFPPADLGFLAWVALAPLFWALVNARRPRHAFGLGYLFGVTHWGATIYWIGTTVVAWTHSPIGWIAWMLLTAIKSGWFGLFGVLAWWVGQRTSKSHTQIARVLGLAAAWTVVEWLRGQTAVAMPWSLSGYTQYRYLTVIQAADLAGVYAISFGIALVNAAITSVAEFKLLRADHTADSGQQARTGFSSHSSALPFSLSALYFAVLLLYGNFALHRSYEGPVAKLALMQPNIGSTREDGVAESEMMAGYGRMVDGVMSRKHSIFVWPESTASDVTGDNYARNDFEGLASLTHSFQLVGTGYKDMEDRVYNSAALFAPTGRLVDRYDKNWLVPMGEWVPMRGLIPFGNVFHFPEDTTPGTADKILKAGRLRICMLICYESVFPVVARTRVRDGANLLILITNDSWAGQSSELQQHLAMTAFRAVETRRFVASAATTGMTCLIEPTGAYRALPPYQKGVLECDARLRTGLTPYVRFGDWLVYLCIIGLGVALFVPPQVKRNYRRASSS